ncbi:bifunctional proline dehydrogenase/L-glutamate gamma-semialdehyde dehydrogenase PutA [Amphiplicatus metriothermophilus]|uniref:Bifunctional protein PutA n=1 Tax=Amphiplicatus metriothermophilus TaxID=1519374 RepID=A0A239PX94_9PROT|nr:bifunctional proline dehydrogenase/L-glutamate gamma-semialdehyde dehydrogenase PutA [Amphiplicatus metriothermophilus]MBB5519976.1 RHH-type proline utilization regulon transcriptional repressor/proline dehydrogenase/delta 1-pyrroline-5-carboxylate dehydrogenase [Amphiplicatus metriothermophilus]SNT74875.1 L-proline dehydrogenase /delta-1-pyrroline-5-carboxylate dehydrogenase [Amphiplicatus metriothermophilus]
MPQAASLAALRHDIRAHYLADETARAKALIEEADIGAPARRRAQAEAADFVRTARAAAERSSLVDKFLQEYGLSTAEGVTLMRLAEALLRTPDAATADALIKDKVEAGDWAAHKGKSPFPLVNFSTRALMLAAAWLDDVEAKDPARRIVKATKDLLDRVGEPAIRTAVAQAMKIMGEHFVLGETIDAALRRARRYQAKGYAFSYDMLGEAALTAADAEKYFEDYAAAIDAIAAEATADRAADNPGISVKLSALHPRYEYPKRARVLKELGARARALAVKARQANLGFNIDAEEAARLDLSLDLIETMMRDPALAGWDGFGVVVQAYQRRAPFVLDWLAALARETGRRIMVRLVKGAYWDAEIKRAQTLGLDSYPVFTRKALTDVSFAACARRLLADTDVFYPQFATHNALTAAMVREMAGDYRDYEFQRLHGMGEALHDQLLEAGARSRIYAPVGGHRELLPYLVRRLLENGANSSFVNQLIDPDLSVDEVVADPVEEAKALAVFPNPAIPAPRDLFDGARLLAKGRDHNDPLTAEALGAAIAARPSEPPRAAPIVNGEMLGGQAAPVRNPARLDDIVGEVVSADGEAVARACEAAAAAWPQWAARPAGERAAILRKAADLLEARDGDFIRLAVLEAGKTIPDAVAEVREAVDFLRYYPQYTDRLPGEPLGVVACISPWNFPLAIFLGQITGALAAGNAVVAKPAEQTPLIAFEGVRILHEAGVPAEVLHFLPGDGPDVGGPLVAHPAVGGVVFTGSTEVAQLINRALAEQGKTDAALIAETGGINAMIVDSTALLEQAVADVIASAFQSAGQRCSACRVVCVQEDVAGRFIEMLAGAMAELSVGDPAALSTDVGPVIDREALARIEAHCAKMERTARLIARAPKEDAGVDGTFVRPVAYEIAGLEDVKREVFGPVLHLMRYGAEELDSLVDRINALGYGLTLGLHTRIDETMHAIAARARIGNIYVNRNQIGAVVGVQPFGGEGLSGTGPKAGGPHYVKALRRRAAGAAQGGVDILEGASKGDAEALLQAAEDAFLQFHTAADRAGALARAAERAEGAARDILAQAARLHHEHFAEPASLPGPTGESNTLRLKGRGVVLCLGGEAALLGQLAKALAAGNAVIAPAGIVRSLAAALKGAGGPALVHAGVEEGAVSARLLADGRVRAVVFDGAAAARLTLRRALAGRAGPICPLLSAADEFWRFASEKTLTINTTAAGGDVRLLSMAD